MLFARLPVVALLLGASLLGACGDGSEPPETPTPVEEAPPELPLGLPVLGPALQELTFEGLIEGVLTDSEASCSWFRGSPGQPARFHVLLQGMVGGARHSIRIVIHEYDGPGAYAWDGVEGSGPQVTFEVDSKEKGHGSVFIVDAADGGEIDAIINSPSQGAVHGFFQCPGTPR